MESVSEEKVPQNPGKAQLFSTPTSPIKSVPNGSHGNKTSLKEQSEWNNPKMQKQKMSAANTAGKTRHGQRQLWKGITGSGGACRAFWFRMAIAGS
jgi:hypothetical protein